MRRERSSPSRLAPLVIASTVLAAVAARPWSIASMAQAGHNTFDVISIRHVDPICPTFAWSLRCQEPEAIPRPVMRVFRGGRFEATAQPAIDLIRVAYGFASRSPQLVTGGPKWLQEERYDIIGVTDRDDVGPDESGDLSEVAPLLRALLEQEFKLRVRTVTKRTSVKGLTVMKSRAGVGLRPAAGGCTGPFEPPDEGSSPPCPYVLGARQLSLRNVTMPELAQLLSTVSAAGGMVIDRSGLPGRFDVSLEVTGTGATAGLFLNALKKQLGLDLRNMQYDVEQLLIEHVERPTSN